MSDEAVRIAVDEKEYAIPLAQIEKAKLVLTDELVTAATSLEN